MGNGQQQNLELIEVLMPLPFNKAFTYSAPKGLPIGQVVVVPLRESYSIGVVWGKDAVTPKSGRVREIATIKNDLCLSLSLINFIEKVASYNFIAKGLVLKMVLSAPAAITKLIKSISPKPVSSFPAELAKLSQEQDNIAQKIISGLSSGNQVMVLDGITGSGKTEVYLHAISKVLSQGKQALVLLPEIVLTTQLIERFEQRFGFRPLEWHSGLTPKHRREGWLAILAGQASFVVGARSALFLPFKNLGLIVVDEEHDPSFKQEDGQIYNARDMAVLRANIEDIPIILSSATPSVETEYNVLIGKYSALHLPSRFGEATLPEVSVINMSEHEMKRDEWLSPPLRAQLKSHLDSGRQSLLFLNRRGYSPITLCSHCLHKLSCPNCNFFLVEHRSKGMLQCHYCGFNEGSGKVCGNCGSSDKMYAIGPGVERLEEEVKKILPEARTAILTSDTMGKRKLVEQVLQRISNHEVDIILGTQMVTKGLHFPKLDLVGVIDPDSSMFSGDIRALERTYQLLYQVSGRAGRESDRGLVMIQTYDPDNVVLKNLLIGSRSAFIEAELKDRKAANMPPFSRIALVTLTSRREDKNLEVARDLARASPVLDQIRILGPSPAPLFLLRRQYRHRFVIIASREVNIQNIIAQWLGSICYPPYVRIKVDIDPYNFH